MTMNGVKSMRLLITGGGTGGHIFPGIAVAGAIQKRIAAAEVLFVGTSRATDKDIFGQANVATTTINCSGLKGSTVIKKITSLLQQPAAVYEACKILKRFQPDVVLGVGGYVTGPVIVAAKLLGIPVCIHEQNSIPGLANRLAGKIADVICISIPVTKGFPLDKTVQTGNPVRENILSVTRKEQVRNPLTLLVLGGSQGAHRVNMLMLEAVERLVRAGKEFNLIHQTGKADYEVVEAAYAKLGIKVEVQPFIYDMAAVYREADLAVSRAGATTLAELSSIGIPALLIPYPYAADDHQQSNSEYFAAEKGCHIYKEAELTGDVLADAIESYLSNPESLEEMGRNMKRMGTVDAAEQIIDQCLLLAEKKR